MEKREIKASLPDDGKEAIIIVDYPESLEEAEEAYGAIALLSNAFANWRITLQAGVRRLLKIGKSQEEIQHLMGSAKMGVATVGAKMDPIEASLIVFKNMDEAGRQEYIRKLQAAAGIA